MNSDNELTQCVQDFFNNYLNYCEESESGKLFFPVEVSCARALMTLDLAVLLHRMRVLSNANPRPEPEQYYEY